MNDRADLREALRLLQKSTDTGAAKAEPVTACQGSAPSEQAPSEALPPESRTIDGDAESVEATAQLEHLHAALNPARAYIDHDFNWKRDRDRHPHHAAAHVAGQLLGHLATLGSTAIGKKIGHHPRRVLAHLLVGLGHGLHPGD